MNLVLADTEEFRRVKRKHNKPAAPGSTPSGQTIETEEKRTLGLIIVRGAHIISLSAESPPPTDPSARLGKSAPGGLPSSLSAGPGVSKPAGRGAPPPSLSVCIPNTPAINDLINVSFVGTCGGCWWQRPSPWLPRFPRGASWFPWRSWRYVSPKRVWDKSDNV